METFGVIIVAAGKGSRMGTKESKQYLKLGGKPILVHTLERFQQMTETHSIALVVGPQEVERCKSYVKDYGLTKVVRVLPGGRERQDSVYEGLKALPASVQMILVHDGVRPFVRDKQIRACWQAAEKAGAAVLAVPVKDTIKVIDESGYIRSTPDRKSLWAIQTPQAFCRSLLEKAHDKAKQDNFTGTDDAMLVERLGAQVLVVEGDYRNIKITTPEDLPWAECILQNKGEEL